MTTKIQLRSAPPVTDLSGYQLILSYQNSIETAQQMVLQVSKEGLAEFTYRDDIQVPEKINISVKAALGNIVLNRDVNKFAIIGQSNFQLEFKVNQNAIKPPISNNVAPKPSVINGRLIEKVGGKKMAEVQVIIYAQATAARDAKAILVTVTDDGGYFFLPYPEGEFSSAHAIIGLPSSKNQIPIQLETENNKKVFPRRLLLVFEQDQTTIPAEEQDCGCGCNEFDLHEKKRILEEFSFYSIIRTSDPEIRAYNVTEADDISMDDLISISPTISNPIKDSVLQNPEKIGIRMQRIQSGLPGGIAGTTPGDVAAPPAIAVADAGVSEEQVTSALKSIKIKRAVLNNFLITHQTLTRDNYTKLIEMNDAAKINATLVKDDQPGQGRLELTSDNLIRWDGKTVVHYQATSIGFGHLLHFKQQWIADGYSLGDLIYSLPLAPGQKKQIATTQWRNKLSAENRQELTYRESLSNELSRDRDINEIAAGVINEHLNGTSSSSIASGSAGAGFSLGPLVIGASGGVSKSSAEATQNSMRSASVRDMQSLQDRTVQSASAVRSQRSTVIQTISQSETYEVTTESVANYNHCHAITIEYFEVLRHFKVQQRIVDARECLFIPLPISTFNVDKAIRWKEVLMRFLRDRTLRSAFDSLQRVKDRWEFSDLPETTFAAEQVISISGNLKVLVDMSCPADKMEEQTRRVERVINGFPSSYDEKYLVPVFNSGNWIWMEQLGLGDPAEFYNRNLKDQPNKDEIFQRLLGQQIAQKITSYLVFSVIDENNNELPITIDASLASNYYKGRAITVSMTAGATNIPRARIVYLKISCNPILMLPAFSNIIIKSGSVNYRTRHRADKLFNLSLINNDLNPGDSATIYCGPTQDELRNPRENDVEQTNRLIAHLNGNLLFYCGKMMQSIDREERFLILDGIRLPGIEGQGRSIASLVENRLIGIVGNSMVFPVAPGLNLNPDFKPDTIDEFGTLRPLIEYYNQEPPDAMHVSVPSEGVFAESIMGRCNSCEKKDETRFWRWEESPIPDSPTAINPVSVPTPGVVQPNLQPMPLSAPLLALQNAPAAPDPTGLAGLMNLLGRGDAFRDVTGLTETQKNALAGLQASMASSQSFANMAKELEMQKLNNQNSDKILDDIRNSPELSAEEKAALVKDHFQQRVDGGSGKKAEQEAAAQSNEPSLKGAAVKAAEQGKKVKASSTDADGKTESIEVEGDSASEGSESDEDYLEERANDENVEFFTQDEIGSLKEVATTFPVISDRPQFFV